MARLAVLAHAARKSDFQYLTADLWCPIPCLVLSSPASPDRTVTIRLISRGFQTPADAAPIGIGAAIVANEIEFLYPLSIADHDRLPSGKEEKQPLYLPDYNLAFTFAIQDLK